VAPSAPLWRGTSPRDADECWWRSARCARSRRCRDNRRTRSVSDQASNGRTASIPRTARAVEVQPVAADSAGGYRAETGNVPGRARG
jgi:hypothetical protein